MVARTFHEFLSIPLRPRTRLVLVALVVPLLLSYLFPLWSIHMVAPQYPQGLSLDIYSYRLEPGNEGRDLGEINILNHYIGMKKITREELQDLDWIPFVLGGLVLLCLRVAALGTTSSLVDLAVLTAYVSLVALGRFVYTLYTFGHELDPKAPMTVDPFTPAVIGSKQVANFTTYSHPLAGSFLVGAFAVGVWVAMVAVLLGGRRAAIAGAPRLAVSA
jgi:hypothetical protein